MRQSHSYECLGIGREFLVSLFSVFTFHRFTKIPAPTMRNNFDYFSGGNVISCVWSHCPRRQCDISFKGSHRTIGRSHIFSGKANQNECDVQNGGNKYAEFRPNNLMAAVDDFVCCRKLCNPTPPICHVVIWSESELIRFFFSFQSSICCGTYRTGCGQVFASNMHKLFLFVLNFTHFRHSHCIRPTTDSRKPPENQHTSDNMNVLLGNVEGKKMY